MIVKKNTKPKIRKIKTTIIEYILGQNDPKQNAVLDTILKRHGMTIQMFEDSINKERGNGN